MRVDGADPNGEGNNKKHAGERAVTSRQLMYMQTVAQALVVELAIQFHQFKGTLDDLGVEPII